MKTNKKSMAAEMKAFSDEAQANRFKFCIMSPSGAAQFLARDEAHADEIVGRLTVVGLKSMILHIKAAKDRDVNGVAHLLALEADKPTEQLTVPVPCFTTAKQADSLTKDQLFHMLQCAEACLQKKSAEHAALVAVAEAADVYFKIHASDWHGLSAIEQMQAVKRMRESLAALAAAREGGAK